MLLIKQQESGDVSFLKASPQYYPLFSYFVYGRQLLKINLHAKWIENPCQSKSWFENFAILKSFWLDSHNNSIVVWDAYVFWI